MYKESKYVTQLHNSAFNFYLQAIHLKSLHINASNAISAENNAEVLNTPPYLNSKRLWNLQETSSNNKECSH